MRRTLFALSLALAPLASHAAEHSCSRRMLGAFGPNAFAIISNCTEIFCNPQVTDNAMKQALAHVDDKLVDLRVANGNFGVALQKYIHACKELKGNMNQTGPLVDNMINAFHDFERKLVPVSTMYQELQRNPEEELFNQVSARAVREFQNKKCQEDINDSTVNLIAEAQSLLDRRDVDCSNPTALRPAAAPLARPMAAPPAH